VECAGWHQDKPQVETVYTCPHCQRENKIRLPGRIVAVTKGHIGPKAKR
jgi:hypothetical protein